MWLYILLITCLGVCESREIDASSIKLVVTSLQSLDWEASTDTVDVMVDAWKYIRNNTGVEPTPKGSELSFSCEADFPIVWNITGSIKPPEVLKVQPSRRNFFPGGNISYSLSVIIFFKSLPGSGSSSTVYCQSVEIPEIRKSLDVFREGNKPFVNSGKRLEIENSNIIPCAVTNANLTVTLRKRNANSGRFETVTRGFEYNPVYGFKFEKSVDGEFECTTKEDRVIVFAEVLRSTFVDHDYLPRKRNVIIFTSESVSLECAAKENRVDIRVLKEGNFNEAKIITNSSNIAKTIVSSNGTKANLTAVCESDVGATVWTWDIEFVEPPGLYLSNYEGEVDCISDYPDRTVSTVRCVNPSHCEFMKHCFEDPTFCNEQRQKQFFSNVTARCYLDEFQYGANCVRVPYSHLNGIAECKVRGLTRHWMFFHSLESTKLFDYHNAETSELIQMENIPSILYANITTKFFCKAVIFLVADSIQFEMIFANSSTLILPGTKHPEGENRRRIEEGNVIGELETRVPVDAVGIRCLGPFWNSSDSLIVERRFTTRYLQKPIFRQPVSPSIVVSETGNRLNCSAIGEPQPTYSWRKNGEVLKPNDRYQFITGANGESLLEFLKIDGTIPGEYACEASNNVDTLLGECQPTFNASECGVNTALKVFRVEDVESRAFRAETAAFSATIAIVLVILAFVCILLVFILRKYLTAKEFIRNLTDNEIDEFFNGNPALLGAAGNGPEYLDLLPYNDQYEIDLNDIQFELSKVLGEGEFSTVVKGFWVPQAKHVAVKIAKTSTDVSLFKNLLSEVKIMIHIGGHQNILSLLGVCTKNIRNRNVYIVMELCENGSLDILLRKNRRTYVNLLDSNQQIDIKKAETGATGKKITTLTLIRWSGELACGMEFLAHKGIVHADLAARNVLIGPYWEAKVSDFGLSRKLYESTNYVKKSKTPLPWRWMAAESLMTLSFSKESDVWSYGITLWEIFTLGDVPFPNESWDKEFLNRIACGMRMGKPKYANPEMYSKIVACWDEEPSFRPEFSSLRRFFMELYNQYSGDSDDIVKTALRSTSYYSDATLESSLKSAFDREKPLNETEVKEEPHLYGNVDLVGNENYSNAQL